MIKNKHTSMIKNGLNYMLHIVALFKDVLFISTLGHDKIKSIWNR